MSLTSMNPLDAEKVFFRDYFGVGSQPGFACNLRKVAADGLFAAYENESDDSKRRLLYLNILQLVCMTFEDVGAVMYAIKRKLSVSADFLESYLSYSPGEAYIVKVIDCKTDAEISETFGLGQEMQDL